MNYAILFMLIAGSVSCSANLDNKVPSPDLTDSSADLMDEQADPLGPADATDATPDGAGTDVAKDSLADQTDSTEDVGPDTSVDQTADESDASDPCQGPKPDLKVWLIGDSTVAPTSGWGDHFESFFGPGVDVINRARGGYSSRSFYNVPSSWWDSSDSKAIVGALSPQDYVLIQFGHNDSKTTPQGNVERLTDPGEPPSYEGTYADYLSLYIDQTRAAGATPVLITSVSRMVFGSSGALSRTHRNYPASMKHLAAQKQVTVLDLEEHSYQIFSALGEQETHEQYASVRNGSLDRTHFFDEKAPKVTKMVVDLLKDSDSPLRCRLAP